MRAFDRKLLRDLWHIKGQAIAICLVVACGVATFVMSLSVLASLEQTRARFYRESRFGDVFAQLKRTPNALRARIQEIPGVSRVQTRVQTDVVLDVPNLAEPAVGRLISLDDTLNGLYLRHGRYPRSDRSDEVLAGEAFVDAHGFVPGDTVRAIINGRLRELRIVGVVLSPEYIFQIREGAILPDDERFGVFWMAYTPLAAALNMEGAFNSISLGLSHGASEEEVIRRLDNLTAPYGSIGAYGRRDQVSHRYLSDELQQLRNMALVTPSIFLTVAGAILHVLLARVTNLQREQIATLKAFGYTPTQIGWHYFKLVLAIVVAGVVLGTAAGAWLAYDLTQLYIRFYRFPVFEFQLSPAAIVMALLASSAAALLGVFGAVRRAVTLPPAEAMRPEPPTSFRPTVLERMRLGWLLSTPARMIVRQLERRPVRALISCGGIALSLGILVLGSFVEDAIDYVIDYEFHRTQRQDVNVALFEPTSAHVVYEFERLPGVLRMEPYRSVPTRLRFGHRSRRIGVQGLPRDRELYQLLDVQQRVVRLPADGLVLSAKLAELLGAAPGDVVTMEVLEGQRPVVEVPVRATTTTYAGLGAYMDLQAMHELLREGGTVSGAYLRVDARRLDQLYADLKQTPRVAAVNVKAAALRSFEQTIAENLLRMRAFNIVFASVIAFGVVYNTARISLSERSRELATLRVIGFTRREISAILIGELGILTLAAIPLGLVLGYLMAALSSYTMETETHRIPLVIDRSTYAFAVVVIVIASLFSALTVRRKLDELDLVAVLKAKE